MKYVKPAFEDLLAKLRTDYIDIGMIHYVDTEEDWVFLQDSGFMKYILELREKGTVRHIGLSSHNPKTAKLAAQSGIVEMILFSIKPAFDMLPADEDLDELLLDGYRYGRELLGIDAERAELHRMCEEKMSG